MKKHIAITLSIVILIFLGSCAYYNTFYNAKELYKQANEREIESTGRASRTAQQEYNEVIKKCASILEFYPNSEYVDDAIYLMALSFYHKGGSTSQVFEQCDKLILYFPDSEFYTDALILKSQMHRDLNRISESYALLEEHILNPSNNVEIAKIYLKMAEFYTDDAEYKRARYYLNKIINDYENSEEYNQASYYIGLNYFTEEDFQQAISSFDKFLSLDNKREIKYDARYYITLSNFKLKNYNIALKQVEKLLDDEYRRDEKNKLTVLQGKILLASGEEERGIEVLNSLIAGNQRGKYSAETNYILGDYYLTKTDSLKLAKDHFNSVQRADASSEFVNDAIAKSSVTNQIQLFRNDDTQLEPDQLMNEQFKLAEYYLDIMNLPDSSLVVYDNIIANKDKFSLIRDSLSIEIDSLQFKISNLLSYTDSLSQAIDSLRFIITNTNTLADTLLADSLKLKDPNGEKMLVLESELDSLNLQLSSLRSDSLTISNKLDIREQVLSDFDTEYIPFAHFVKAYIYHVELEETEMALQELSLLQETYPDSKYTYTLDNFLNKGIIKLTTQKKELSLQLYEKATENMFTDPDTTIVLLTSVLDSLDTQEIIKAKLALGYLSYNQGDTLSARTYFQDLIDNHELSDEESAWLNIFYSDNKIQILDRIEFDIPETDSLLHSPSPDSIANEEIIPLEEDNLLKNIESDEQVDPEVKLPIAPTPSPGAVDK